MFPDAHKGPYLLPVKKAVRAKSRISEGDAVEVRLSVIGA
ncbi:DUF1905 domain-containing protein [Arthrobacter sp. 9E06]